MKVHPQVASQLARRSVRFVCAIMGVLALTGSSAFGQQEARKVIAQPTPVYPQLLKPIRLTGTVKVQVVIAPDGRIKETRVIGGHPAFVQATMDAPKNWKYAPSNTETTADLEFNFHP